MTGSELLDTFSVCVVFWVVRVVAFDVMGVVLGCAVVVGSGAVPKHSNSPTVKKERCVGPLCWSALNWTIVTGKDCLSVK